MTQPSTCCEHVPPMARDRGLHAGPTETDAVDSQGSNSQATAEHISEVNTAHTKIMQTQ